MFAVLTCRSAFQPVGCHVSSETPSLSSDGQAHVSLHAPSEHSSALPRWSGKRVVLFFELTWSVVLEALFQQWISSWADVKETNAVSLWLKTPCFKFAATGFSHGWRCDVITADVVVLKIDIPDGPSISVIDINSYISQQKGIWGAALRQTLNF